MQYAINISLIANEIIIIHYTMIKTTFPKIFSTIDLYLLPALSN